MKLGMSICWKCPSPASDAYTWRLPNGNSYTRYYCKTHNPYAKPTQREYSETSNEVTHETDPDELEAFAREKAEDFRKSHPDESL
jgi:hypothetical protein